MLDSTIDAPQLSISDPRYNIREIVKQMLLLEQHLLEESKYCPDCISKHILTIEALAEEGQNLDKRAVWVKTFTPLVGKARVWGAAFTAQVPPKKIGQDVRQVRKRLAPHILAPIIRRELDEVATIEGEFGGGFDIGEEGVSPWQVWAAVLGGVAFVMIWAEQKYGPGRF
tara:strand:+ start:750 stop:1259 length:510 start_codon:yes stop_codon:yes gene_type:complete